MFLLKDLPDLVNNSLLNIMGTGPFIILLLKNYGILNGIIQGRYIFGANSFRANLEQIIIL